MICGRPSSCRPSQALTVNWVTAQAVIRRDNASILLKSLTTNELKIGKQINSAMGNVYIIFGFLHLFVFELAWEHEADRQTDKRMGEQQRSTRTGPGAVSLDEGHYTKNTEANISPSEHRTVFMFSKFRCHGNNGWLG